MDLHKDKPYYLLVRSSISKKSNCEQGLSYARKSRSFRQSERTANNSSNNEGACDTVEDDRVSGGVSSEEDDFLRQRWLECCDHLSAFYIEEETYKVPYGMGPVGRSEIPTNAA